MPRAIIVRDEDDLPVGRHVPCQQYELVADDDAVHLVVWLDRTGLSLGTLVRLKETGRQRWWRIVTVYGYREEKSRLHKPWRVGGLQ